MVLTFNCIFPKPSSVFFNLFPHQQTNPPAQSQTFKDKFIKLITSHLRKGKTGIEEEEEDENK
ncbi:hypothetical protein G4B88_013245 [Cannabis sativa]|uniref:Uncharacterized protein n=1 Tax=Cannabis sativa TaxID=3483 RepID=A0A7J6H0D7_CANSA|nr:hypothetical protein G4B88_013245 [Cannabis sativa]